VALTEEQLKSWYDWAPELRQERLATMVRELIDEVRERTDRLRRPTLVAIQAIRDASEEGAVAARTACAVVAQKLASRGATAAEIAAHIRKLGPVSFCAMCDSLRGGCTHGALVTGVPMDSGS
jgi:hypothetical protein